MLKKEIDPKIAAGIVVALVVLVLFGLYYFVFRTPSGELSPEQAGVGKPMKPGELPPGVPPPPWPSPQGNPSGQ